MATYEQLAKAFIEIPIDVLGVYKNTLPKNRIFRGHVDYETTKCACLILLRGQAGFIFNHQKKFVLQAGGGFFGGVNMSMEMFTLSEDSEYYLVHYLPSTDYQGDTSLITDVSTFTIQMEPELLKLLEKIQQIAYLPDTMEQLEKKSLFYHLVASILQGERFGQNQETYPVIQEAISYIQRHYTERLTLQQIANQFGMTGKYFSYLFHKYTGVAPIDYLIRYRLSRAEEMLYTTDAPIHEIAIAVGYEDPNYFSRIFKTHMGVSPKQKRQMNRVL